MDRRVKFFAGGSLLAAMLAFVSLDELRIVPIIVSVVYALLALAIHLDSKGRASRTHKNL